MYRIERWAYENRLHRRHPGEKLALAGGMLLLSLTVPPLPGSLLVAAVMGTATVGVAGVPWRDYLRVLAVPAGFIAGGAVAMGVSVGFGGGGWRVAPSPEGMAAALPVVLRSLAAVSSLSFLALTTPVLELAGLLRRWRHLEGAVDLALAVHRFLHVLTGTAAAMRTAQEARLGYATPGRAYRSLGLLAACLLPRALGQAARLERGLMARGYQGSLGTLPVERRLSPAALAGAAGLVLGVAALSLWWG